MIGRPRTRYAKSGDLDIAYSVVGDGPVDLLVVPPGLALMEGSWEFPPLSRFWNRLASFARLILLDKRGTGLSDRVTGVPTLEERMDDVKVVMEAVGSERAALFGGSEAGPITTLFAATSTAPSRSRWTPWSPVTGATFPPTAAAGGNRHSWPASCSVRSRSTSYRTIRSWTGRAWSTG